MTEHSNTVREYDSERADEYRKRTERYSALDKAIKYFDGREPKEGSKSVVEVAQRFLEFMRADG